MAIDTLTNTHLTVAAPPTFGADQRETAAMPGAGALRADTLSVLDTRSRRSVIPRHLAPAGHYLELRDGDDQPSLIPLERSIAHVGRAVGADLRFEDAHVSRRHAIVVRYGNHVRVLDDRSSAGTFVNGVRVIASDLQDNDVIRLGPIALTYVVVR
jgi:hypothetical protein